MANPRRVHSGDIEGFYREGLKKRERDLQFMRVEQAEKRKTELGKQELANTGGMEQQREVSRSALETKTLGETAQTARKKLVSPIDQANIDMLSKQGKIADFDIEEYAELAADRKKKRAALAAGTISLGTEVTEVPGEKKVVEEEGEKRQLPFKEGSSLFTIGKSLFLDKQKKKLKDKYNRLMSLDLSEYLNR